MYVWLCVLVAYCMCEEPVGDNVLCLYEGEVQPNEAPLSPPQLRPPLSPWDDDADSDWWLCPALLSPPSIPPIPCSCAPLLSGPTCSPWLLMQSLAHH